MLVWTNVNTETARKLTWCAFTCVQKRYEGRPTIKYGDVLAFGAYNIFAQTLEATRTDERVRKAKKRLYITFKCSRFWLDTSHFLLSWCQRDKQPQLRLLYYLCCAEQSIKRLRESNRQRVRRERDRAMWEINGRFISGWTVLVLKWLRPPWTHLQKSSQCFLALLLPAHKRKTRIGRVFTKESREEKRDENKQASLCGKFMICLSNISPFPLVSVSARSVFIFMRSEENYFPISTRQFLWFSLRDLSFLVGCSPLSLSARPYDFSQKRSWILQN